MRKQTRFKLMVAAYRALGWMGVVAAFLSPALVQANEVFFLGTNWRRISNTSIRFEMYGRFFNELWYMQDDPLSYGKFCPRLDSDWHCLEQFWTPEWHRVYDNQKRSYRLDETSLVWDHTDTLAAGEVAQHAHIDCCRAPFFKEDNGFSSFRVGGIHHLQSIEPWDAPYGSPQLRVPAYYVCEQGVSCSFQIPVLALAGSDVAFELTPFSESLLTTQIPGDGDDIDPQPLVLAADGTVTWDAPPAPGEYVMSVQAYDVAKPELFNTAEVNIRVVDTLGGGEPPEFVEPTPSNGETLIAYEGELFELTAAAEDPDDDAYVIEMHGPVNGDISENANGQSTFSWTPTVEDLGPHLLLMSVTNDADWTNVAPVQTRAVVINVLPSSELVQVNNTLQVVSGPTPPQTGQTTIYDVTVTVPDPGYPFSIFATELKARLPLGNAELLTVVSSPSALDSFEFAPDTISWPIQRSEGEFGEHTTVVRVAVTPGALDHRQALAVTDAIQGTTVSVSENGSVEPYLDGAFQEVSAEPLLTAPVEGTPDQPPNADAGGDIEIVEGDSVVLLDGSKSSDPEGELSYRWELLGQSYGGMSVGVGTSSLPDLQDDGAFSATLTVTDALGQTASDTTEIRIRNAAPSVSPIEPRFVTTGATVGIEAQFTDPGPVDTHSATVDWGSGSAAANVSQSSGGGTVTAQTTASGVGSTQAVLCVQDDDGGQACESFELTVVEPPSITEPAPRVVDEGSPFIILEASATAAPEASPLSGFWELEGLVYEGMSVAVTSQAHAGLRDDGALTANLHVTDALGGEASAALDISVVNVPPAFLPFPSTYTIAVGENLELAIPFVDAGLLDTHDATVAWDDGAPQAATVTGEAGQHLVQTSKRFVSAGTHTASVCVSDDDGAETCQTLSVRVVAPQNASRGDGGSDASDGDSDASDGDADGSDDGSAGSDGDADGSDDGTDVQAPANDTTDNEDQPETGGCSAAGGAVSWPALLSVLLLVRRRRALT